MPTVVDELVMEMGLGGQEKFRQGLESVTANITTTRDMADKSAKAMEASGARAAEFFSRIRTEALSLIGVLAGSAGLGAAIKVSADGMADLNRSAANLGISTRDLGSLQNVMERHHASAQSITGTLENLQTVMQNFRTFGNASQFAAFLGPIGATIQDTPMQVFLKAMRYMQEHPGDTLRQNQILHGLLFNDDSIKAMREIRTVQELLRELAAEQPRVPDEKMTESAIRLYKAWSDLEHQTKYLGDVLTDDLAKPLTSILDTMTQLEKSHPNLVIGVTLAAEAVAALKAIRILASFLGMKGLVAAIDGATGVALSAPIAVPVALSGDTGPTPPMPPGGWGPEPSGPFAAGDSTFGAWWQRTMPSWLGGASTNPGNVGPPPAAGTPAASVMEQARRFFLAQGYTAAQVAGILANIQAESSFNPRATDPKGYYGLFQWSPERQLLFRLWSGHDIHQSTVAEQLAFAQWELTNSERIAGNALHRQTTAANAARVVSQDFLRPLGGMFTAGARAKNADLYLVPPSVAATPPAAQAPDQSTSVHVGTMNVHLPSVRDPQSFAAQLPAELTAQANRGLR